MLAVDTEAATKRLMRFLAVEGVTGQEAAIGKEMVAALKEAGVPARCIRFDDAHTRIPLPTQTGNLIVDLPGRGALEAADRLLFMTHMDTVPLCAGAKPKRQGKQDRQRGQDGARRRQPHRLRRARDAGRRASRAQARPPAADAAVHGARGERAVGRAPREPGGPRRRQRWASTSTAGRRPTSSSARSAPTAGRSRSSARRRTPASPRARHLGDHDPGPGAGRRARRRLVRQGREGRPQRHQQRRPGRRRQRPARPATPPTSSPTTCTSRGESRSHDAKFVKEITAAYKAAFAKAAAGVTNSEGKAGRVKFTTPHRLPSRSG